MTRTKLYSIFIIAILIAITSPVCFAQNTYKIKQGDSLWNIAKKYHTTPAKLAKANGIKESSLLALGKKITIPGQKTNKTVNLTSKQTKPTTQSIKTNKTAAVAKTTNAKSIADSKKGAIKIAMSLQGIRYRTAGTSRSGFDCSGFTRYVYAKIGVKLPHSSASQAALGRSVSKSQLQQGDLVFFNTNRRGISHVGIYIGNNKFVHSANHGSGVRTDSLGSAYYSSRYVCARRVK